MEKFLFLQTRNLVLYYEFVVWQICNVRSLEKFLKINSLTSFIYIIFYILTPLAHVYVPKKGLEFLVYPHL